MFERIDKEEDGDVYVKEVVDFLKVLDNNLEQSHEVFDTDFSYQFQVMKKC